MRFYLSVCKCVPRHAFAKTKKEIRTNRPINLPYTIDIVYPITSKWKLFLPNNAKNIWNEMLSNIVRLCSVHKRSKWFINRIDFVIAIGALTFIQSVFYSGYTTFYGYLLSLRYTAEIPLRFFFLELKTNRNECSKTIQVTMLLRRRP